MAQLTDIIKKPLKIKSITLGCKVNQYESDEILGDFKKIGFDFPASYEKPDILIINTCSVTHKAAIQSKQAIRMAIHEYPQAIILATGCYVQSESLAVSKIKGIDYIIGNTDKHKICEVLNSNQWGKKTSPVILCQNIRKNCFHPKADAFLSMTRARPFVKIQDGCNAFCTYCIVPYTRGPSHSRPFPDIINEITFLATNGAQEIVLTGIHIGVYGLDFSPPYPLFNLLEDLLKNNMGIRIRLSSIEPNELTDNMISLIADSKSICPHFHIPLQSGDNNILQKMNRSYSPDFFKSLIKKIHQSMPNAAIGVDVIAGFPGETDEAFNNTALLIDSLPISYIHAFPFSAHKMTPAGRFKNQIHPDIIKSRVNIIRQLGREKKMKFYQQMIGQNLNVIVESQKDKASNLLKGVSENYVKVFFKGDDILINKMICCKIVEQIDSRAVLGKPV